MAEIRVEKRYIYCTPDYPRPWHEVPEHSARAMLNFEGWRRLKETGSTTNNFAEYRIIQKGGGADEEPIR